MLQIDPGTGDDVVGGLRGSVLPGRAGSSVVITADAGSAITLQNVALSNLHADDVGFL